MQPYFLPYIGYFCLINAVDKFVFADDLQYIRRGWVNRNRIKVGPDWKYLTVPVKKNSQKAPINKIGVVSSERYAYVLKRTLEANYGRCPHFSEIKDLLFDLIVPGVNLSKTKHRADQASL